MEKVIDRMEMLRVENGLTKKEFAELCGVHPANYSGWISGRSVPSERSVIKVAETFQVLEKWRMHGVGERTVTEETKKKEEARREQVMKMTVVYRAEDAQQLKDIEEVIGWVKDRDIDVARKKRIYKTLSTIRGELESKVIFGEVR